MRRGSPPSSLPHEGEHQAGLPALVETVLWFLAECAQRRLDEYWSALDQARRSLIAVRRLAEVCLDEVQEQPNNFR